MDGAKRVENCFRRTFDGCRHPPSPTPHLFQAMIRHQQAMLRSRQSIGSGATATSASEAARAAPMLAGQSTGAGAGLKCLDVPAGDASIAEAEMLEVSR